MSQPKKKSKHNKHEESHSSSLTAADPKKYFHRSSQNNMQTLLHDNSTSDANKRATASGKKSGKMGALKKWLSRFGSNDKTDESKAHSDIEKQLGTESKLESTTLSVLLLGAGGSGKSTVLKQMDKIHNSERYEDEEKALQQTIVAVHKNITLDIYDLCKMYYIYKQKDTEKNIRFKSSDIENLAIKIATNHDPVHNNKLTSEFAVDIELLWNTDTMKKVYEIRKKSHIMDNTPYFLDKVRDYADPNYIVSFDDFVRIRDQTTGIIQTEFTVDNGQKKWLFKMTDVGGQRAERRKWLHVFAGIDVVIYVMSLSAYDQVLYEDHNTRCWDETFNLFENTAKNKSFKCTDFIIFLNKDDIFQEKIKEVAFTVYYKDFNAEEVNNPVEVVKWCKKQFTQRFNTNNGARMKRGIHFHVTCATDTAQIENVVRYVQIELIRKLMSRAALF